LWSRSQPVADPNLAVSANFFVMPTEDYPGPTKSHPEKEDKNDPPRPGAVEPVRPPLPTEGEPAPEKEGEEE
jgi:hypothetical protein